MAFMETFILALIGFLVVFIYILSGRQGHGLRSIDRDYRLKLPKPAFFVTPTATVIIFAGVLGQLMPIWPFTQLDILFGGLVILILGAVAGFFGALVNYKLIREFYEMYKNAQQHI